MDPNETLHRILAVAQLIVDSEDDDELGEEGARQVILNNADDLASAVLDLHSWIKKGGFLPTEWTVRDRSAVLQEITNILKRQLPQGIDNAAAHIAICIDTLGKPE